MYNINLESEDYRPMAEQNASKVQFPYVPDDTLLIADERYLMTNDQILTREPKASQEEALMRFSGLATVAEKDKPTPQVNQYRTRYNSVQRPIGADIEPVNTNERTFVKRSRTEEVKARAKRAAVPPRKLKGYVSPLEKEKKTLAAPKKAVETTVPEFRKRALRNSNPLDSHTASPAPRQTDLFNPDSGDDYFAKKRAFDPIVH